MNADALDMTLPKRILSRYPTSLWVRHFLSACGTVEDLDQIVWEVCLEPKHRERLEKGEYWSLSGYVAAKLRHEVLRCKRFKELNIDIAGTPREVHSLHFDSRPWEYIDDKDRELVKDRFYAYGDRDAMRALCIKHGLKSTSALRMRAKRAVDAAKRKYADGDNELRQSGVCEV